MEKHSAHTCRWARPTLFLPLPDWIDARDAPWSCRRREPTRLIESATECAKCTQWERRRIDDPACDYTAFAPPELPTPISHD